MWDNSPIGKFQVEQWLPPYVVEKIKKGGDGWVHLFTQINVPKEQETCICFRYTEDNPTEFFINGELVPEDVENFKEVESRLETGL